VLASALGAYIAEGGNIAELLQPWAFLLVCGVTFGVVLMACGFMEPMRQLGALLRTHDGTASSASDFASLRRALYLVIQSAPLAGFIGSVLGMIHVMSNVSTPDRVGAGLAVAMVAMLYGLFLAMISYGLLVVGEGRWDAAGPSDGDSATPEQGPTSGKPVLGAGIVLTSTLAVHLSTGNYAEQLMHWPAGILMGGATLGAMIIPSGLTAPASQLGGLMRAGGSQNGEHALLRRALSLAIPIVLLAGLVGSVLGSIDLMGHLDDPSRLGAGVAMVYIALLYAALIAVLSCGMLALAGGGRERGRGPSELYALSYAVVSYGTVFATFAIVLFAVGK
jgi:flagellar motor component MotA